jgi:8-oxo-dGTP diphosphatase
VWAGLPTGYARARETFQQTVIREVREETGLRVAVGDLVRVRSGYRLRAEAAYAARYLGGQLGLNSLEILEARWCTPDDLPAGVIKVAAWKPRTSGRGGNAAPPSRVSRLSDRVRSDKFGFREDGV